jgi:tRNA(His) 5'-end guanylyltransferase
VKIVVEFDSRCLAFSQQRTVEYVRDLMLEHFGQQTKPSLRVTVEGGRW